MLYGYLYSAYHRRLFRGALYLDSTRMWSKIQAAIVFFYIVTIFAQNNVGSYACSYFTDFRVMNPPPLHHRSQGLVMTDAFTDIFVCATSQNCWVAAILRNILNNICCCDPQEHFEQHLFWLQPHITRYVMNVWVRGISVVINRG